MGQRKPGLRAGAEHGKNQSASIASIILKGRILRDEIARFKDTCEDMGKRADPLSHPFLGPYRTKLMQNEGLSEEEQYSIAKEIGRRLDTGKKSEIYLGAFQILASYGALAGLIIAQPGWTLGSAGMLATLIALSGLSRIPNRRYKGPSIDAAVELMKTEMITSQKARAILMRIALDEDTAIAWLSDEKKQAAARFLANGISDLSGEDRKKAMDMICRHGSEKDQRSALARGWLNEDEKLRLAGWLSIGIRPISGDNRSQEGKAQMPDEPPHGWLKTARDSASDLYRNALRSIKSGMRFGIEVFVELPMGILAAIADIIAVLIAKRQTEEARWKEIEASGKKRIALAETNGTAGPDGRRCETIPNAALTDPESEPASSEQTISSDRDIERNPSLKA